MEPDSEKHSLQSELERLVVARTDQLRNTITALEKSYDTTLEALGSALRLRDPEAERHSKCVAAFSIVLAKAIGVNSDQIR